MLLLTDTYRTPQIYIYLYISHLQEGQERGSGELQACQPDLGAGEGYGADHPECHHRAHAGQPGDQAQPAWGYERQVLLD